MRLAKILSSIEFKFWQSDGLLKPGLLHYGFIFVVLAGLISAGRYEYFGKWQIPSSAVSSLLTTMLQIAAAYLIQFFPQTPIQQRYYGLLYTLTVVTSMALIIFILTNIDKANKLVDWLYDLELSEWAVSIFYGLAGSLLFLVMTSVRTGGWVGPRYGWMVRAFSW